MINRIKTTYINAYSNLSREVWLLSLIVLINRSGSMVLAFLTIYFTNELGFSISESGVLLSFYGLGAFFGTFIGGKLADLISSIRIQLFSLICSGLLFFGLEYIREKEILFFYIPILSFCTEIFRPANSVSITHFSKDENRARAFALNRLAINFGMAIGPAAGGYLATQNFSYLFRVDGVTCLVAALCVLFFFNSSDVTPSKKEKAEIIRKPHQDKYYLAFLFFIGLNFICFMQAFSTFPLVLKMVGHEETLIGIVFTVNATIIVLFEMVLVHKYENRNTLILVALGIALIGLGMFFNMFAHILPLLFIGVIIWTVGEIISFPFMTTHVSSQSNDRNRGVYMGYFGATLAISNIIAPSFGTFLLENYGSEILWGATFLICTISATGIYYVKRKLYTFSSTS